MYVGVIHRVPDPEGSEQVEEEAVATTLPDSFALPIHSARPDHRTGVAEYRENAHFGLHVDGFEEGV